MSRFASSSLSAADNPSGTGAPGSSYPVCDPTTITGLTETSTGTSQATYDTVICNAFGYGNVRATTDNSNGPGLVLSDLPEGSSVYIPFLTSPLTVNDCGSARIYSRIAYIGAVTVSGATHPKTGFLGLQVAEGGQRNPSLYNFTINDNQNLLVGPYYSEQSANDVSLSRGAGTTTGRVGIQVFGSFPTPTSITVNIDNYAGRFFYGNASVGGGSEASAVQIDQTGANPIDLMMVEDSFNNPPAFNVGPGANLIAALNQDDGEFITDTPNPLSPANYASIASSLDDFRQLSALSLDMEYGIVNPSGLVGYWKLDETAGPSADSTMSGMTGTWENSPTPSTDTPPSIPYADSGSMSFNGSNSVSMSNISPLPSGTHARTICGWAKPSDLGNNTWRWIVNMGTNSYGAGMFIGMYGTTLYCGSGFGDDIQVPNFWDENWHFICMTYDGTTANVYADGNLVASAPENWNLVPGVCNLGQSWVGEIDDARVYNRALSAAEVSALGSGLVAHWNLDEATGPSSYDSSPNGLTGTWENNPTFTTNVPPAIKFPDPGCLSFNGTNQSVDMGTPAVLPSGTHARTLCGWGKLDSTSGSFKWIASYGANAYAAGMFIGMNGTTLYAGAGFGADLQVYNFWDNNWHFIALTYDGTTASLYADGVLKTSAAYSWNLQPGPCTISNGWPGSVDDVRIYDRALSATEISNLAAGNP